MWGVFSVTQTVADGLSSNKRNGASLVPFRIYLLTFYSPPKLERGGERGVGEMLKYNAGINTKK